MDTSMLDAILKNGGVMGAVFLIVAVPLAAYTKSLAKELKDVQDARALDAQQTVDKLLALNDKWNATVSEHIRTVVAIDTTLREVKTALQSVRDLLLERRD